MLELDNEFSIESDILYEYEIDDSELMADVPMAESVEFDSLVVEGQGYWNRIDAQENIDDELKAWLKSCYL